MSDVNPVAPVAATLDPKAAPAVPGTAPLDPDKYVTRDQYNELIKRLDGISGNLRKLEPIATAITPKTEPKEPDTLTKRVEAVELRESKLRDREQFSQIRAALIQNGVPAKNADRAAKVVIADHKDNIQTQDDYATHYIEGENKTPVDQWIGAYMKTDDGKFFLPSKALPTGDGLTGGQQAGPQTHATHPMANLAYTDIMKHPNVSLRSQYMREYREEFQKKERTHRESRGI